jgi:hypothetical protein
VIRSVPEDQGSKTELQLLARDSDPHEARNFSHGCLLILQKRSLNDPLETLVIRVLSPSGSFHTFVMLYQRLHVHARRLPQVEKISEKYFWDF